MTVKDLKKMIADAPEDMIVYVMADSQLGGFLFKEACIDNSGIAEFGEPDYDTAEFGIGRSGFCILSHDQGGIPEDELDSHEPFEDQKN